MEDIPKITKGFTNIKGQYFPNVREISFEKGQLCSNLGKLVAQTTKEKDDFFVPDDFDLMGVYIYQSKNNPKIAYRIYKEFAEYKFNGYNDDILIENLQKKQSKLPYIDFPTGVVTVDGRIIGQEITYYENYQTLFNFMKNENIQNKITIIYEKIIFLLKELYNKGIIYTDNHAKNFLVDSNLSIKLIDFEYSQVKFEDINKMYMNQSINNLRNMINLINQFIEIDYQMKNIENFDDALEQVDIIRKRLKK